MALSYRENSSMDSQTGNAYDYSEEEYPAVGERNMEGRYGELILLGYNGPSEQSGNRKQQCKMELFRRKVGNGVKKANISIVNVPASQAPAVLDSSRHVVSYAYSKNQTVLVEYTSDPDKDMFQIGRSSEDMIDFTVMDTQLASAAGGSAQQGSRRYSRPVSSTISRYACRMMIHRENPSKAYVYAAGFDASKNIFLGEKASKWTKKNKELDGLTTNGILILHPDRPVEDSSSEEDDSRGGDGKKMYVWREVSVDGDIYSLRETRSSNSKGSVCPDENNMLQDGTLIDLCGATLLWRSADGLEKSPSAIDLESALNSLNAGKPQCPVNMNTLIIPKKKTSSRTASQRQPYVYLECGHVQGKHKWGQHTGHMGTSLHKCPICMIESERVLQLTMGMQPAFHLDSGSLDYAFNPCGHVASLRTVRYWSAIPLPHGTNSFHPVCPFCTTLLAQTKPFVRLIFQDHLYDS
ncbi:peli-1 [Pristionchus pacificus]|uniref:Peli-1 n=1 Tax=Pristionchus pacificus TaxID=54126 RepID=A0A2A6CSS6_PRIPA|nr:peli-1 [Pristionchus pacificus]|eukprot:PDM81136.1 peli-1 [Pristionchus pacificus]